MDVLCPKASRGPSRERLPATDEPFPLPDQYVFWGFQNRESAMVGVWGPECFGVSQFPRGPAEVQPGKKVRKEKFSQEKFSIVEIFL